MSLTAFASGTFTPTSLAIESSTNATPISIHIVGHGLTTGDLVYVANHATNVGANGFWTIVTAGADDFTLTGSVGVGVGGATGTVLLANESFVSDVNVAGEFYFVVDTINMAAGDALGIRIYQMLLTGGTSRVVAFAGYAGAQPAYDLIKHSVGFSNELTDSTALRLSLRQLLGVQRSFPWKILKVSDPSTVTLANPQGIKKNAALANFEFVMFNSNGDPATGLTGFTKEESIDGAAFAALSGAVTEVASGMYKISLTSGELNGDVITLRFAATGAKDTLITIKTVQP
jgi:hypothetical protein